MNPTASNTRVGDAMTSRAVEVDGHMTARDAAARMAEEGVGALAVRAGRPAGAGVVTERDLVVRLIAQDEDPQRTPIGECVDRETAAIEAGQTLEAAGRAMQALGVERLPVVRGRDLVGLLTLADLAAHDPDTAHSVRQAIGQRADDDRSAAWLFHRAYRDAGERTA
jgi:CBS domain-containing protein